MRALVVVDLGFGDSGKGLLTDYLARRASASSPQTPPLIIRYNGGAQAGHNVVAPDGRHHTFAQFGAGTLVPGARTFLSRYVVIHPTALLIEGQRLAAIGIDDAFSRLRISEDALLITPFHQAMNRLRELYRGPARHGSCGTGVGEAVADSLSHPEDTLLVRDLRDARVLRRKLGRIRDCKAVELSHFISPPASNPLWDRELAIFSRPEVSEAWIEPAMRLASMGLIAEEASWPVFAPGDTTVIFEGAQGVLLDELRGFHPFTTWSRCTTHNALALLSAHAPQAEVRRLGVVRAHAMRHGPGPLPTETDALRPFITDHNGKNDWQGDVRQGWFDAVPLRYALEVAGPIDALMVTHLDAAERLPRFRYCDGYESTARLAPWPAGTPASEALEWQGRLTKQLLSARPILSDCAATEQAIINQIEFLADKPVALWSRGPRATDVSERGN